MVTLLGRGLALKHLGGVASRREQRREPACGVGELAKHQQLPASRKDAVLAEQHLGLKPLGRRLAAPQSRLQLSQHAIDRLQLLPTVPATSLDHGLLGARPCLIVLERSIGQGRVVEASWRDRIYSHRQWVGEYLAPPPKRLDCRLDRGGGTLAVDRPDQGRAVRVPGVDVCHDCVVRFLLGHAEPYRPDLGKARLEQRFAVIATQILFHAAEEVQLTRAETTRAVVGEVRGPRVPNRFQQVEQCPEVVLVAPVGGGGKQHDMMRHVRDLARRVQVLRGRGEPVRLVEDRQRPRRLPAGDLAAHIRVASEQVERHQPDVHVSAELLQLAPDLRGDALGLDPEQAAQVSLPLGDQVGRDRNERLTGHQPAPMALSQIHPGHDRLAGPRLVSQEKAQPRLWQHRPEHRAVLVRIRPQRAGGEHGRTDTRNGPSHPPAPQTGQCPVRAATTVIGRNQADCQLGMREIPAMHGVVRQLNDAPGAALVVLDGRDQRHEFTIDPELRALGQGFA